MTEGSSVFRQTWALTKRYLIHERRKPLASLTRNVIWPGLCMLISHEQVIYCMRHPDVFEDGFEMYLPYLLMLVLSAQLFHSVAYMISDKTSGMKSLMLAVGLRRSSYYVANLICFLGPALPVIMFVARHAAFHLFRETQDSRWSIFLVFVLFEAHMGAFLLVFNSLLRVASLSIVTLIVSALNHPFHLGVTLYGVKYLGQRGALFLASADPYESVRLLTESYINCRNNGTTLIWENKSCIATGSLLIQMLFWITVAYSFAIWFDSACPWQTDSARRNLSHLVRKVFWQGRWVGLEQRVSQMASSKYMEPVDSGRRVGISIKGVSKDFSGKQVLEDVDFEIYHGETTLLLGHNGAGKTTLMNVIMGKLMPDAGHVAVDRISARGLDNGIGICPQTSAHDEFQSVRQHLEFFSDIKGTLMGSERQQDISTTMSDVSLDRQANSLPSELSGGMKRKLSLGMAFVGKSSILILDEPSSGLDPDSRVFVWNAIRRYRADRTVLLSTQHMEEADYLGDRIAIMSRGKIICCGSSVFLTKTFGSGYKLRVECLESKRQSIIELARKYFKKVKQSDNEHAARLPGSKELILDMVLELKSDDTESNLISLLEEIESNSQQLGIKSHGLRSSSIEDVLLNTATIDSETPSANQVSLTMSSREDRLSTIVCPKINPYASGQRSLWKALWVAFMRKHLNTYKNDWKTILFFRLLIGGLVAWKIQRDLWIQRYSPSANMPNFVYFALLFHFIHYPIVERVSGFKRIQMTSSANTILYWLAQLSADMMTVLLAMVLVCILTWGIFDIVGTFLFIVATLLFGIAGALNCYVLSALLRNSGLGLFFVALYFHIWNIIRGLLAVAAAFLSLHIDFYGWYVYSNLLNVFVYPTDAYYYIMFGIVDNGFIYTGPGSVRPAAEDNAGLPPLRTGFCSLLAQILVFGALLYRIEDRGLDPSFWLEERMSRLYKKFSFKGRTAGIVFRKENDSEVDEEVREETRRAEAVVEGKVEDMEHRVVAHNLCKSYKTLPKAVDQLSFVVRTSECFGLLGVNGAGKSTTFSMMVGAIRPESGQILIAGCPVAPGGGAYMKKLAYAPQMNPTMSLTASEALYFMARLRCVEESAIPDLVSAMVGVLDMSSHANKVCHQLSGGTMKKLVLGMSLVGSSDVLLLDEPTAGVDLVARRSVWQLLNRLKTAKACSIVISSHAMEECEAICNRISIMARGRLRCVGTFLHLRAKFAQGCTLRIQLGSCENHAELMPKIVPELAFKMGSLVGKTVEVVDQNANSATYSIPTSDFKRSELFKMLRDIKQQHPSITYMVNDSSLEDVFIRMAQEQRDLGANNQ